MTGDEVGSGTVMQQQGEGRAEATDGAQEGNGYQHAFDAGGECPGPAATRRCTCVERNPPGPGRGHRDGGHTNRYQGGATHDVAGNDVTKLGGIGIDHLEAPDEGDDGHRITEDRQHIAVKGVVAADDLLEDRHHGAK